jgi:hypothetical protein
VTNRRPAGVLALARVSLLSLIGCALAACQRGPAPMAVHLEFQPQSAVFEVTYGGEASEDFWLTAGAKGQAAPAVTSLAVEGAVDPDLTVQPLPPRPGSGPGLRIHAVGRRVGMRAGTLQVMARPDQGHPIPLLYALRVRGTLTVVPTNPLVDLRAPEPAAVLTVRDTQPEFVVTAVEVANGPFAATMARQPDGGAYSIRVTVVPAKFPAGERGAAGTLVIHSSDRVEPRKEVPLFAFGRAP